MSDEWNDYDSSNSFDSNNREHKIRNMQNIHENFGYLCMLTFEQQNVLNDYLYSLPEFHEWDKTGMLIGCYRKIFINKHSKKDTYDLKYLSEEKEELIRLFDRYKRLYFMLRNKVKVWCRENL